MRMLLKDLISREGMVYLYDITGVTKAFKPVSVFRCNSQTEALKKFIKKYPRFKGAAKVQLVPYKEISKDVFISLKGSTEVGFFHSTKTIKNWV